MTLFPINLSTAILISTVVEKIKHLTRLHYFGSNLEPLKVLGATFHFSSINSAIEDLISSLSSYGLFQQARLSWANIRREALPPIEIHETVGNDGLPSARFKNGVMENVTEIQILFTKV